jgi:hypothetical protein
MFTSLSFFSFTNSIFFSANTLIKDAFLFLDDEDDTKDNAERAENEKNKSFQLKNESN